MVLRKNSVFEIKANEQPLVSIIIPVYNTEKYLRQCLDSCINQTYKNIEIICVDDCSTDKSYEILLKYKNIDSRIHIFKNLNTQLAGYSRNFGIKNATGKYIYFCDSDDWLEQNLIQICISKLEKTKSDICIFDYTKKSDCSSRYIKQCRENLEDSHKNIFNCIYPNPWSKIFNKKFIIENKIQFSENLHNCNDLYFVILAAIKAKKICYANCSLYNYRTAVNNSSQTTKDQHPCDSIIALNDFLKKATIEFGSDNVWQLYEFIFNQLLWNFNTLKTSIAKKEFIVFLKKNAQLLEFPSKIKFAYKLKHIFLKLIEICNLKNNIPKFSIIIPVYNTEKYLRQCLDSCINQTYKNIEIICVDDCSTDKSYEILQKYAIKDKRIKIFKTNNSNLYPGNLRNIALDYCIGDYILCVDSDDYIDIQLIHELNIKTTIDKSIDYILYSATPIISDSNSQNLIKKYNKFLAYYSKYDTLKINNISGLLLLTNYGNNLIYSNCLHCIKASILIENKIKYVNDIIFEDELFTRESLQYAKNVLILQSKLYYRRVHSESIMSSDTNLLKKLKSIQFIIYIINNRHCKLLNNDLINQLKNCLKTKIINLFFE